MRVIVLSIICGLFLTISMASVYGHEVLQGPTEVRYWDVSKAYNGYTLFGARGGTYLIDMEGRVVRRWSEVRTNPRFLDNGNILDSSTDDPSRGSGFVEVDWEDNVVWRYTETRADYDPHHDFIRIFNKKLGAYTTLYIANKSITHEQAIAAGCDPSRNYEDAQMDAIVEVDMDGNIVWEWWFFDHVVQDIDPTKANYVGEGKTIADHPGRININLPGRPLKRDWLHCNSMDYHPVLGHIVTNSVQGEFYVIDHDGTFVAGDPQASISLAASEAGDFLYRFGDPARYEQGDPPAILEDWTQCTVGHKQIGGSHDIHWIDEGLPGAGHFLVFNNGQYLYDRTCQSYAVEINGFLNAAGQDTGHYVNPPEAGYMLWETENKDTHKQKRNVSNQIVWQYGSKSNQGFFSHIGSGAQRLPNGNTLICAMTEGHVFEVTADGDLVWEYINPVTSEGVREVRFDDYPMTNALFRAYRYAAEHPALAGRDLTGGQTITGREPSYNAPPSILQVAQNPLNPGQDQIVTVEALVTDNERVTAISLTYFVGDQDQTLDMFDDGTHGDRLTGDDVFTTQIPGLTQGTVVDYLIIALDNTYDETTSPAVAPQNMYQYTVGGSDGGGGNPSSVLCLPDTGQTGDYTLTFGEDSDYTVNPPSYTDNGDGTISDNVTALIWQKNDGGEMTWEQAISYSQSLILAGHADWRLPTSQELFGILNHDQPDPAIDTNMFPDTGAQYWWTSQTRADDSARVWVVNAGGGIGPHPKSESQSAGGDKRIHVRCVRTEGGNGGQTGPRLVDNGDGTVTDSVTGLVWQKAGPAPMIWEEALLYSEGLSLGNSDDWRLPNIKELRSLCDESLTNPAADTAFFPDMQATTYWSSTTLVQDASKAWTTDFRFGIVSYQAKTDTCHVRCVRGGRTAQPSTEIPQMRLLPAGQFEMGDHHDLGGAEHANDEIPIHTVILNAFHIGVYEITNQQFCSYLNSALSQGLVYMDGGFVYGSGTGQLYCQTYQGDGYSRIYFDGSLFSVADGKGNHPVVGMRWLGAAAYCNWLSAASGYAPCYDLNTGRCDFSKDGFRLPTEAEWEYAGRGGRHAPYRIYPWGDDADNAKANWPNSGDPYEAGELPWTTPVGFYNGQLRQKTDFLWPGPQNSYQPADGSNGFGLYDMAGNVWEWVNDWYNRDYYSVSPQDNPGGPETATLMPDGLPYHCLRGGNWYNGPEGHSRVSNRNPAYYRGPQDPDHPWYHIGFRIARNAPGSEPPTGSVIKPGASVTEAATGFAFAEGPVTDSQGNVFFSDLDTSKIYRLSTTGQLSVFLDNSGGANGLAFDTAGNLIACQGDLGRLVSIDAQGGLTVLADQYNGNRFNKPNDLWIDPKGGVYFTDPAYGTPVIQDGEHVYYLTPDRQNVVRVIDDMVRPNGIIGTPDGQVLYVTDHGADRTYRYGINADGTLSNKVLFAAAGSDGMTIDNEGNVYLTGSTVTVYNPAGDQIEVISPPGQPTNLCFGGSDGDLLFITTHSGVYTIEMRVTGAVGQTSPEPTIIGTTHFPTFPTASDPVSVRTVVTGNTMIENMMLSYGSGGGGSGGTNVVFLETMRNAAVKPWTGDGCDHEWIVTASSSGHIEQRTQANYDAGNPCGMEFGTGTNDLTQTMIETANSINAVGTSGYVEFWLWANGLEGTDGWTFQLDSGSGYTTRVSELTGSNHDWQLYHYDLLPTDLTNNLKMRFQFRAGDQQDRIRLDFISVTVSSGEDAFIDVSMYDDGVHGDGVAGDGIYGGQIPAFPTGTTVDYYVTAIDHLGAVYSDPLSAPDVVYSYVVREPMPDRTVGLFMNDQRAFEGYTLFAPKHNTMTYLIDNQGREIHSWQSQYEPGQSVYLLENGHLLHTCFMHGALTGGGEGGRIEEYDWEGNLVWEFDYATNDYMSHHDIQPLPNGNVLVLVVEKKSYAEVIAAGFDPDMLHPDVAAKGYMLPDSVIEVEPSRPAGGNIVWEWHVWDHLIQDYDATKDNYGVIADHPELVNANGSGGRIAPFWNHMNSIAYNGELDQIVLSVRGNSELWIIDHNITSEQAAGHTGGRYDKGGDLLYRWGNSQTYDAGNASDQMLFQQHDAQWIEADCPGAGNILIYNNGLSRNYSSVDEIVPPVGANGSYSLTPGLAYGPEELVWTYYADPPTDLYSEAISGAQRLPNGNTLICDGTHGVLLEVTAEGETVWKYINPVVNTGILTQGEVPALDIRGHQYNAVFKVHRYAPDYPGLAGKDLTPGDVVELCPEGILDLDGDCLMSMTDLAAFAVFWQQTGYDTSGRADLTGDGKVDARDLAILAGSWLNGYAHAD